MTEQSLGLSDVLKKLRRADEALTEFVAPLWPGVKLAGVWIEGAARLFTLPDIAAENGYYLLGAAEGAAHVIREADEHEAQRFRNLLGRATVILVGEGLAYPASFSERLQGITAPRAIHFAAGSELASVQARFDGINLFFDNTMAAVDATPLGGFLANSSIFSPGELLGLPGQEQAGSGAKAICEELQKDPERATAYRLTAVLDSAGAVLEDWSRQDDTLTVRWRRLDKVCTVTLSTPDSPITSGICLPGARNFDAPSLTRLLLDHALDGWR